MDGLIATWPEMEQFRVAAGAQDQLRPLQDRGRVPAARLAGERQRLNQYCRTDGGQLHGLS